MLLAHIAGVPIEEFMTPLGVAMVASAVTFVAALGRKPGKKA
jgi:hypothetical protein